jgi:hypothetical protein
MVISAPQEKRRNPGKCRRMHADRSLQRQRRRPSRSNLATQFPIRSSISDLAAPLSADHSFRFLSSPAGKVENFRRPCPSLFVLRSHVFVPPLSITASVTAEPILTFCIDDDEDAWKKIFRCFVGTIYAEFKTCRGFRDASSKDDNVHCVPAPVFFLGQRRNK